MREESRAIAPALPPLTAQFERALQLIDNAHAEDSRHTGESNVPYELHYAKKMSAWLAIRCPEASPILQVACRAQHFRRYETKTRKTSKVPYDCLLQTGTNLIPQNWEIPRDLFPMNRSGYLTWRAKLKAQAATQVSELLQSSELQPPIPQSDRARIAALIRKEKLDSDLEAQALEDVACLVFLDDQFDDFEKRDDVDEAKIINILRKTWGKMSQRGREIALGMKLSHRAHILIGKALADA